MAANINDKFSEVSTGTRPTTTTVASVRSVSGSSLVCDDLTGWTTDTAVHFVTYEIDGQGNLVPGTQQDMKGIVSGNTISNIIVTGGTDIGNKVGDIVQQLPTAAWAKDLADGIQVSHNQDGTLKADSVTTAAIQDEAVTSDKVGDGEITPEKRSGGFAIGQVDMTGGTGNRVISGLGFKPKLVKFFLMPSDSNSAISMAHGHYDGNTQSAVGIVATDNGNFSRMAVTDACFILPSAAGAINARAVGVSLDNDGFTINATHTNNTAPQLAYEAYG